jgi:prepilin-type N-terminal cleavage/methylation domain-containing protein
VTTHRTIARVPRTTHGCRTGVTLVELLVALVVLGIVSSLAGLALQSAASVSTGSADDVHSVAARARSSALRTGRPVTLVLGGPAGPRAITALPDGRVVGATSTRDDSAMGEHDSSDSGDAAAHDRVHDLGRAADVAP